MAGRVTLAVFFIIAGILHFILPNDYLRIMPPMLPWPKELVWISGVAEIVGGIGLLLPRFQRAAAWSLAALLVAVFPANIYMAVAHLPLPGLWGERWVQWARLPLQIPLILWALKYRNPAATR